jgi:hypothetical protein
MRTRPDTSDDYICQEVERSYGRMRPAVGDVLLDMGKSP